MKKIITTNETANSASPYKVETKKFLQDAVIESLDALAKAIIGKGYVVNTAYKLYGLVATGTDPGARTVSAGALFYNGEIYLVPAATPTTTGSDVLVCTITETADAVADPTIFSDGQIFNIHNVRTVVVSAGASGSADFDFDDIVSEETDWVDATLAANTANTGSIYANAGYRKERGGIVRLRGRVTYSNTSSQSYATLFTLPASYRPLFGQNFVCEAAVSTVFGSSDTHQFSIQIDTAGLVKLISFVRISGVATADISLDNISFPTT